MPDRFRGPALIERASIIPLHAVADADTADRIAAVVDRSWGFAPERIPDLRALAARIAAAPGRWSSWPPTAATSPPSNTWPTPCASGVRRVRGLPVLAAAGRHLHRELLLPGLLLGPVRAGPAPARRADLPAGPRQAVLPEPAHPRPPPGAAPGPGGVRLDGVLHRPRGRGGLRRGRRVQRRRDRPHARLGALPAPVDRRLHLQGRGRADAGPPGPGLGPLRPAPALPPRRLDAAPSPPPAARAGTWCTPASSAARPPPPASSATCSVSPCSAGCSTGASSSPPTPPSARRRSCSSDFFGDYQALAAEAPRFSLRAWMPQARLLAELHGRFDFGLLLYPFPADLAVGRDHLRGALASKLFAYLAAGLPVLVSEELEYMATLVREHGIGLVLAPGRPLRPRPAPRGPGLPRPAGAGAGRAAPPAHRALPAGRAGSHPGAPRPDHPHPGDPPVTSLLSLGKRPAPAGAPPPGPGGCC